MIFFRKSEDGSTYWGGWARMAHPIEHFAVVEVAKPNIGETRPSRVRADVTVNLAVKAEVKAEWENLRKHDVCFLITVRPPNPIGEITFFIISQFLIIYFNIFLGTKYKYKDQFIPQVGLQCVRGCEIEGMLDSNGRVIEDGPDPKPILPGMNLIYLPNDFDLNQFVLLCNLFIFQVTDELLECGWIAISTGRI